jgi:nicotinamide riboside kinase
MGKLIYKYSQLKKRLDWEEHSEEFNIIHDGQLKCFLSELQFLINYLDKKYLVVYVGAAAGYHISYLASLFPDFKFHLYDGGKFGIQEDSQIKIFNKNFTDEDAKKYADMNISSNILFMSDIRNLDIGIAKKEKDEEKRMKDLIQVVDQDMIWQQNWVKTIQPRAALLKFKLSYEKGKTEYFDGTIYLQVFAPASNEARLHVTEYNKTKIYDNKEYDEKLAYYNYYLRNVEQEFGKDIINKLNIINNNDSAMLICIAMAYLEQTKSNKKIEDFVLDILKNVKPYTNVLTKITRN